MYENLISIVIVDDDDAVREALQRDIDWAILGYRVAGAAEDGIAGIELIEEFEPDIVITDVLMPCMDGLAMIKEIQNRGHHPRIIILSGHDEFEYARTAITLSVDAYVNKPLNKEQLIEILNQSKKQLDNERRFAAQIKNSLPLLRQAFFSRLFSGYYRNLGAIREQADFLELSLGNGPFLCAAARIDPLSQEIKKRNALGREFLKDAVLKLVRETAGNYGAIFSYNLDETGFMLLFELPGKNPPEDMIHLSRSLEEVIHLSRARLKIPLTLGLSALHNDISGIVIAYQEALKALSCDHLLGTGRIIALRDLNFSVSESSWEMQDAAKELVMAVRLADAGSVNEQLSRFYRQVLASGDVPMIRIRMDASVIAFALINEADSWLKEGRAEARGVFNEAYTKIQTLGTIEDIVNALKVLSLAIVNLIEDTRLFHHKTIIHKAIVYIETNYQNKTLSFAEVACAVGVSQSHLSFLFNKEVHSSFNKYVTKLRIEHAMGLLKEDGFKTYEVADMVGYSNAQYFSVSFKKYTGVSPLQFRTTSPAGQQ